MGHFITDRLHSKGDGSAFYPYGESKTGAAGDDREQFATYTRDQSSGLDYADQRWYSSRLGRFTSPDPYMADSGGQQNPMRPSSWGKYGYVEGDPISYNDPSGLMIHAPIFPGSGPTFYLSPFPSGGGGGGGGVGGNTDEPSLMLPPLEPDYGAYAAVNSIVNHAKHISSKGEAKELSKVGINALKDNCLNKLGKSREELLRHADSIRYWDARIKEDGKVSIQQFIPEENVALGATFRSVGLPGSYAYVLIVGGDISKEIVLRDNFFGHPKYPRDGVDQAATLVHELLHSALNLGDILLASNLSIYTGLDVNEASARLTEWVKKCFN
jgi:RHS repeat-associated protein